MKMRYYALVLLWGHPMIIEAMERPLKEHSTTPPSSIVYEFTFKDAITLSAGFATPWAPILVGSYLHYDCGFSLGTSCIGGLAAGATGYIVLQKLLSSDIQNKNKKPSLPKTIAYTHGKK
jgi:hypothetical protein